MSISTPTNSSSDRPLKLRLRLDLEVYRQRYQGREFWVVKDPLRLKYFRFEEEEFWLLQQLDGTVSLETLRNKFEERFAPQRVLAREVHQLISLGHQSGLILAEGSGQGEVLLARKLKTESRRRWNLLSEILSLRFRGIDPDRLLTWLNRYVGFFFFWPMVLLGACLGLGALLLLAAHFGEFRARLPGSSEFFGPSNWLALAATLAIVKILHELGHGLTCKRYGGECHEMGVLLLCFTPCLYCDVTDSWMLPSKWQRAAIGAAGMYVELWLAALATFAWWYSEPGLLHHIALNIMFVGSVSTLVFNANPLMRYDGYYILSDLVEIPNLRMQGANLLRQYTSQWLLGTKPRRVPFMSRGRKWFLAGFAVASSVYRWIITAAIVGFLYRLTEPYGIKIVGQMLALVAIGGLLLAPLYSAAKFLSNAWQQERDDMNYKKALVRLSLLAGLFLILFCLPLPYYIRCAMRVQPREAAAVFVDISGQVEEIYVQPGERVEQGQPLLKLRNLDLELALAQLATECDTQSGKVAVLRQRSLRDDSALAAVAQAEEALLAIQEERERRQTQWERLTIRAPQAGVVLPAPREQSAEPARDRLASWQGHPLESRNLGATLPASTLICQLGDPAEWEAVLAIAGDEVEFVQPGQRVDLLAAQRPGKRVTTKLASISQREVEVTPTAMSAKGGGEIITRTDSQGQERPTFVTYEAAAPFDDATEKMASGGIGIARIHAGYQTLATRLWRTFQRTFHFQL